MSPHNRFQIVKDKLGSLMLVKLVDTETGEYVSVLPSHGGTICEMKIRVNDRLYAIIDGYQTEQDVKVGHYTSYKSSKLFPFPNRIAGGKFIFEGKENQLEVNETALGNAIHGLVHDQPFEIVSERADDVSASIVLRYNYAGKAKGFPYKFEFDIEYKWTNHSQFSCKTIIRNNSDTDLPCGDGWHPYFISGKSVNDLFFQFPAIRSFEVDDKMIPTGVSKTYSDFNQLAQIGDTNFDTCFELEVNNPVAEIIIFNKKEDYGYKIWQETGFEKYNYLQIYTPPSRKSIAIEPMTCLPDVYNNRIGLIVLKPGELKEISWGVSNLN